MLIYCVKSILFVEGTPGEVFKAITYSPSESIIFEQTQ